VGAMIVYRAIRPSTSAVTHQAFTLGIIVENSVPAFQWKSTHFSIPIKIVPSANVLDFSGIDLSAIDGLGDRIGLTPTFAYLDSGELDGFHCESTLYQRIKNVKRELDIFARLITAPDKSNWDDPCHFQSWFYPPHQLQHIPSTLW